MNTLEIQSPTIFQTLINDYARYNAWANQQLINWLRTKPTEKVEEEVPSSFPTLKQTLTHIWKTQLFWLDVIQQQQRSYTDGDAMA